MKIELTDTEAQLVVGALSASSVCVIDDMPMTAKMTRRNFMCAGLDPAELGGKLRGLSHRIAAEKEESE